MATTLDRDVFTGIDISSYIQVSSYTNTTSKSQVVLGQVQLSPVVGGGAYALRTDIDALRMAPDSNVVVASGATAAAIQSRSLILEAGATLTVQVLGLPGDTAVNTVAEIVDVGPLTATDLYGLSGEVVDHNYGSTDAYTVLDTSGAAIADVQILLYLQTDYNAGNRGQAYIKARSSTNVSGQWREPVLLEPATYVAVFSKSGSFQTKAVAITVTASP